MRHEHGDPDRRLDEMPDPRNELRLGRIRDLCVKADQDLGRQRDASETEVQEDHRQRRRDDAQDGCGARHDRDCDRSDNETRRHHRARADEEVRIPEDESEQACEIVRCRYERCVKSVHSCGQTNRRCGKARLSARSKGAQA